jgi:hypothetical protein
MKAEIKESTIATFDPIVISLTIESEEELHELWHRTDPDLFVVVMNEFANKYSTPLPGSEHGQTAVLFQALCACMSACMRERGKDALNKLKKGDYK